MTPADLLARELRRDGARPLVTWYDDGSGGRVELSVATAANWAAKTANLLVDELDLGSGDTVTLDPPAHWLAAVAALGTWTAGLAVTLTGDGTPLPGDPDTFVPRVLAQPDALVTAGGTGADVALVAAGRTWTAAALGAAAAEAVTEHALPPGCRVLSTLPLGDLVGLDAGLLVPLAAGGSVVLVARADTARLADRAAAERVTHTAGVDLPGLPRLR